MKRTVFLVVILSLVSQIYSRAEFINPKFGGIEFVSGLSLQQVLVKAKKERKFIFLDCYATWCMPCKWMDENVYHNSTIGDFINKNFIAIKVQMDRTNKDTDFVKNWYNDAKSIETNYLINAYPTYLFLAPNGDPVHRGEGILSIDEFLVLAKDALNPQKQSYSQSRRINFDSLNMGEMKLLARSLRSSNPELSQKIAKTYLSKLSLDELSLSDNLNFLIDFKSFLPIRDIAFKYIDKLDENRLYTTENMRFILQFIESSKTRGFSIFYNNADKVDSILNVSKEVKSLFAVKWVDQVIYKEEIDPYLQGQGGVGFIPDWEKLYSTIKEKFNESYAERNILVAKINWFGEKGEWPQFTRNLVLYMENYGVNIESDWGLNHYSWMIFKYSDNKSELEKALKWSGKSLLINPNPSWFDTYANLLYKAGFVQTAIKWEELAVKVSPNDDEILKNLDKMKKGEPTWTKL